MAAKTKFAMLLPIVTLATVALSGCTAESELNGSPSPSSTIQASRDLVKEFCDAVEASKSLRDKNGLTELMFFGDALQSTTVFDPSTGESTTEYPANPSYREHREDQALTISTEACKNATASTLSKKGRVYKLTTDFESRQLLYIEVNVDGSIYKATVQSWDDEHPLDSENRYPDNVWEISKYDITNTDAQRVLGGE